MEQNSSPVINERQTNSRLIDNFEKFKILCNTHIPGVVATTSQSSLQHQDHFSECLLPLCRQFYIEDITDIIAKEIDINILFAKKSRDGKHFNVVGFTKPTQEEMYLLFINSSMYGVVDEVSIAFYDSIEKYFEKIKDLYFFCEYERQLRKAIVLEKIQTEEMFRIFYN